MQLTPSLHQRGFYEFKLPWKAVEGVSYECIAIRTFGDIYKLGIDVYETYYKRVGLEEGKDGFTFDTEAKAGANIITLKGTDSSVLYVPDTYITRLPDETLIPYSEVVLATSLGALPDELNLDEVKAEMAEVVGKHLNIKTTIEVGIIPLLKNPTKDEHDLLEKTRLGNSMDPRPNYKMLYEESQERIKKLNLTINILLEKMLTAGLITAYTRPKGS